MDQKNIRDYFCKEIMIRSITVTVISEIPYRMRIASYYTEQFVFAAKLSKLRLV